MIHVTSDNFEFVAANLKRAIDAHAEWLVKRNNVGGKAEETFFAVRANDVEITDSHCAVTLGLWHQDGNLTCRVTACELSENQLVILCTRRAGHTRFELTLIARPSFTVARDEAHVARLAACSRLTDAALTMLEDKSFRLASTGLSRAKRKAEAGRYARIVLQNKRGKRVYVTADLTTAKRAIRDLVVASPDAVLTSAVQWFLKTTASAHTPNAVLWIASAAADNARELVARCAVLRASVRERITILAGDNSFSELAALPRLTLHQLVQADSLNAVDNTLTGANFPVARGLSVIRNPSSAIVQTVGKQAAATDVAASDTSEINTAARRLFDSEDFINKDFVNKDFGRQTIVTHQLTRTIQAFAADAIDVIAARHGATVRYHGLPFARVRRLMQRTHLWLGFAPAASLRSKPYRVHFVVEDDAPLDAQATETLAALVCELRTYRAADSPNRRHFLYRTHAESWLESLLRRDITRLDAGLRLAPLHLQFRPRTFGASLRPVDLLALRRDGRLVVIELKTAEDVNLPIQAADYFRRVETWRRRGKLAHLFDDAIVKDLPPLVYLVAPGLRFARSFETLARLIDDSIKLYRYDLNEDWRAGVRVPRREMVIGDR